MRTHSLIALLVSALVLISSAPEGPGYGIGDTVSDFRLKNFDGKMISLSDYRESKGVILIFDCNTCPYSKAYNDRIAALHKEYAPQGFPVVTINSNDGAQSPGDSFKAMVAKAKEENYTFPYLVDETQRVALAFGATNTPHVFVLQRRQNNFIVAYIGAIDNNARDEARADKKYVKEAVDSLLAGKTVSVQKTKAVGCGIRWKDA